MENKLFDCKKAYNATLYFQSLNTLA